MLDQFSVLCHAFWSCYEGSLTVCIRLDPVLTVAIRVASTEHKRWGIRAKLGFGNAFLSASTLGSSHRSAPSTIKVITPTSMHAVTAIFLAWPCRFLSCSSVLRMNFSMEDLQDLWHEKLNSWDWAVKSSLEFERKAKHGLWYIATRSCHKNHITLINH